MLEMVLAMADSSYWVSVAALPSCRWIGKIDRKLVELLRRTLALMLICSGIMEMLGSLGPCCASLAMSTVTKVVMQNA